MSYFAVGKKAKLCTRRPRAVLPKLSGLFTSGFLWRISLMMADSAPFLIAAYNTLLFLLSLTLTLLVLLKMNAMLAVLEVFDFKA